MVDQGMNKKLMIDFANCTQLNFLIFPESISPMQDDYYQRRTHNILTFLRKSLTGVFFEILPVHSPILFNKKYTSTLSISTK